MKKILILLFLSVAIFGCFEDKSSYDYSVAETIDLDELLSTYNFPTATVGVEYEFPMGLPDSLHNLFEFRLESYNADSLEIYSTGDTLRFYAPEEGTYLFLFVAINKEFGTYSVSSYFKIEAIEENADNAWLILGECDGKTGLSLINPLSVSYDASGYPVRSGYEVKYNVNTDLPTDEPSGLHLGIAYSSVNGIVVTDMSILLESKSGSSSSCYFLNNSFPFPTVTSLEDNIIDEQANFSYKEHFHYYNKGLLVSEDGSLYKKVKEVYGLYSHNYPYYHLPFTYDDEEVKVLDVLEKVTSFPFLSTTSGALGMILQNESGKKFLKLVCPYYNFQIMEPSKSAVYYNTDITESVDLDDMGDWELVFSHYLTYSTVYMLFKKGDEAKMIKMVRSYSSYYGYDYVTLTTKDFPRADLLTETTKYHLQETVYLFFAQGNKVYRYIFDGDNLVEEYYAMNEGETITGLEMNAQERELLVGTDKGSISILDVTKEMDLDDDLKLLKTIEGFSSVYDVVYRYQDYKVYYYGGYTSTASYWD